MGAGRPNVNTDMKSRIDLLETSGALDKGFQLAR